MPRVSPSCVCVCACHRHTQLRACAVLRTHPRVWCAAPCVLARLATPARGPQNPWRPCRMPAGRTRAITGVCALGAHTHARASVCVPAGRTHSTSPSAGLSVGRCFAPQNRIGTPKLSSFCVLRLGRSTLPCRDAGGTPRTRPSLLSWSPMVHRQQRPGERGRRQLHRNRKCMLHLVELLYSSLWERIRADTRSTP